MVSAIEVVQLQSELRTIEELMRDLCERKRVLSSKLACLEQTPDVPAIAMESDLKAASLEAAHSSTPTWAEKVKQSKFVIPSFDPSVTGLDDSSLALSNFFAPLAALTDTMATPPSARTRIRKRRASAMPPASSTSADRGRKRPRLSQTGQQSTDMEMPPNQLTPPINKQNTYPGTDHDSFQKPSSSQSGCAAPSLSNSSKRSVLNQPPIKYILLGDSIIRGVAIPNCITYSYSGAKILDLERFLESLIEKHPLATTIIIHIGINDIKRKESIKIGTDFEHLATTIESLGKTCIFSGLIPAATSSSELFSRIYATNQWLKNFCSACGFGFVENFETFWKKSSLYRDRFHPNHNGQKTLTSNIQSHLEFEFPQL